MPVMVAVAVFVFLTLYLGVATLCAWLLYKLSRGYEAAPPLTGSDLWKRSVQAGGVAVGITLVLVLLGLLADAITGKPSEGVSWVMMGVELFAWAVFCIWLCDLQNLLQGVLYAVAWMIVLRGVAFLVFLPFGIRVRLIGGLGFN